MVVRLRRGKVGSMSGGLGCTDHGWFGQPLQSTWLFSAALLEVQGAKELDLKATSARLAGYAIIYDTTKIQNVRMIEVFGRI